MAVGLRNFAADRVAAWLLLLLGIALFLWLASARAWVNDDAFITFRYAHNVAAGHGIVWNVVEPQRVEGSTSLAWTLLNAAAVRAGLEPLPFSHGLGLLAGACTLLLLFVGARRGLALAPLPALVAPALLCAERQWVLWSVSGMEMTAATMLLALASIRMLREQGAIPHWKDGWGSGLLFAMATLLRPESPLLHAAAAAGILLVGGRRAWRPVATSTLLHAVALLLLTGWRLLYFGQPLPNTFYAKVGALQLDRGLEFVAAFVTQGHILLQLGVIVGASVVTWKRARLPLAAFGMQGIVWLTWVAALGGGRWEFRLLVPILPALALLTAVAVAQVGGGRAQRDAAAPRSQRAIRAGAAVLLALLLVATSAPALHRPFRSFGDVLSSAQLLQSAEYVGLEASLLRRYLGPRERICTGWAGAIPYFTRAWHFDPWGLNTPEIARRPLDPTQVVFHQRHALWSDLRANRVMFCDLFNHFLFPAPFDPRQRRGVVPWVQPGVSVYSARLPEGHYWVFTSTRARAEVESRLSMWGLELVSVMELPAGWPRLGE
ncbi:MAG: hypothetical protein JSW67_08415 [Candidatus Latescibacterota bacterium]|nr:MAG: hypothetical protein JSW67_08415 [Candidatus Latescibacterota bacterium]